MSLLTDEEIKAIYAQSKAEFLRQVKDGGAGKWEPLTSARAIEAAVIEKLGNVENRNTETHEHLSTLIGLWLGARERGDYKYQDGSVVDKAVKAAIEHLKDWPFPELERLTKVDMNPVAWIVDITLDDDDQLTFLRDMIVHEDGDLMPIRLVIGGGHSGHGLYVASADYPDEGAILLAPTPASTLAAEQAKVCEEHLEYPSLTPKDCATAIRARGEKA